MQMYASARASAGNHEELQRHITDAMATKAEWESKVHVLQQELQSLANATPELLTQLEYEVEEIKGVVADMQTEKQGFVDQTVGLREAKAQLKGRSEEVQEVLRLAKVRCAGVCLFMLRTTAPIMFGTLSSTIRIIGKVPHPS
jgi:chromosome segregation ATPase